MIQTFTGVLLAAILLVPLFGRNAALETMGVVAVIGVLGMAAFMVGQIILDRRN